MSRKLQKRITNQELRIMNQTKTLSINKKLVLTLAQFGALLGIATLAPLFHNQPITGSIVNAALFLTTALIGVQAGVLVALFPSLIALSVGLLPAVLAVAIPFIITGNIILVSVFNLLKKNFWQAIITASITKFIFLYSTSFIVVNLIAKKPVAQKATSMLSWPQLATALAGGTIAWLVIKALKKC